MVLLSFTTPCRWTYIVIVYSQNCSLLVPSLRSKSNRQIKGYMLSQTVCTLLWKMRCLGLSGISNTSYTRYTHDWRRDHVKMLDQRSFSSIYSMNIVCSTRPSKRVSAPLPPLFSIYLSHNLTRISNVGDRATGRTTCWVTRQDWWSTWQIIHSVKSSRVRQQCTAQSAE